MKKKIKDLTFDDCEQICFKHKDCNECPLIFRKSSPIHCMFIAVKCEYKPQGKLALEREVEVDE